MAVQDLKDFIVVKGDLYHRDKGGVLARTLSLTEAKRKYVRFMTFLVDRMIVRL